MIKLSELKAARAEMTPGEWTADGEYGSIHANHEACGISSMGRRADAVGIVATHNAADVLIEIAEAAKALGPAKKEAARVREMWIRSMDSMAESTWYNQIQITEKLVREIDSALAVALAKVTA
jgi:hypothetical protein